MSTQQPIEQEQSRSDASGEEGPSSKSLDMAGALTISNLPVPPSTVSTKKKKKKKKSKSNSAHAKKKENCRSQQADLRTVIPLTIIDNKGLAITDDYSTESDEQAEALTSQEIQDQRTKLAASEPTTENETSNKTFLGSATSTTTSSSIVPKPPLQPASAARQNTPGAFSVLSGGVERGNTGASPTDSEPLTADVVAGPSIGTSIEAVAVDEDLENQRIREIEQRYEERLARLARREDPGSTETTSYGRRSSSFYLELRCSKKQTKGVKIVLLVVGVVALLAIALLVPGGAKDDEAVSSSNTANETDDQFFNQLSDQPTTRPGGGDNFEAPGTECSNVEMQTSLPNQNQYKNVFGDVVLDVSTNSPYGINVDDFASTQVVFDDVQSTFQSVLIPIIAGCRRIVEYQPQAPPEGVLEAGYFEYFHENRFMLANGFVGTPTIDGDCNFDEPKPCLRINVPVDLYLKGTSTFADFRDLMFNYFGPPLIDLMVTSSTGTYTKQVKLQAIHELVLL